MQKIWWIAIQLPWQFTIRLRPTRCVLLRLRVQANKLYGQLSTDRLSTQCIQLQTKSTDAVDKKVQYASNADDLKVIQATETYAGSGSLLPVGTEKNAATPAEDWLERMREEDARIQRAMAENDEQMFDSH